MVTQHPAMLLLDLGMQSSGLFPNVRSDHGSHEFIIVSNLLAVQN